VAAAEGTTGRAAHPGLGMEGIVEDLAREGWRGFARLRRYLADRPGEWRALARQVRSVAWERRGDLEARRVRFAFLGDSSTANLQDPLLLECLARGVVPAQYHAPTAHVSREIRDPASGLWAHRPDVVVLAVSPARRAEGADGGGDGTPSAAFLDSLVEDLRLLRAGGDPLLLVHNFLAPEFRPLGLHDWRETEGLAEKYSRLNHALAERCREIPGTHVVDLAHLGALSGARWWTLHKTWFLGGLGFPEEVAPLLCREYAAFGAALRGLARKCLVVDLDDTLWGGVVGEAGAEGVEVGADYPGNIFREIQRVVGALRERGVVLAINSSNNEEDAWRPFERRPEMALRREDFAAWRINWQDKAANLRELSAELRLGLDAFVFLDNDPVVQGWIEEQLPEVHVLPARDPLHMLHALASSRLFEGLERTAEDGLRGRSYSAANVRRREEQTAADREAFLAELDLSVTVGRAAADQLPRLAQLSQRTNQFNLTTRRYTHPQLAELCAAADAVVLSCACRDRFADEGVTGVVILRKPGAEWVVDTFALSCRVLGWGVERALAAAFCRIAAEAGAVGLEGQYLPTAKNRQTEFFYRDLGFTPVAASEAGSRWRLALPAPADLAPPWIRLRVEQDGE